MLVVLAHSTDVSAHWAAERLRARSPDPVELVLVETLGVLPTVWRHELGAAPAHTEITLGDGRHLRTGDVRAVLNRMLQPPLAATSAAVDGDADYARNELTAFAASWLRTLAPRVLNEPTPQGLCGRWRAPLHWRALAREAGLPVAPYTFDSRRPPPLGDDGTPSTHVLAVGGEPLAPEMPGAIRAAAARLARAADTPVLGLRFAPGGWRLLDATPYPDLSSAGEDGIAALEAQLAA